MLPLTLWSNWEAETCQLSTKPCLDALCEIGVSILSTESTVPTCCLSQTSAGITNVSIHPAELLLSLLLQAIFSHTGSVLHTDLWRPEPGDLEEGGNSCQSP